MRLTGPQIKEFWEATLAAFDPVSLEMLLFLEMDRRLHDYALGSDFREIVFKLLVAANQQGWIEELVRKAAAERQVDARLQTLAQQLQMAVPPMPVLPVGAAQARNLEKIIDQSTAFADVDAFLARFQRVKESVCRVAVPGGGGTGFLIAPDLVLTNFHVIESVLKGVVPWKEVHCVFGHRRNAATGDVEPGTTLDVDPAWKIISRSYSAGDLTDPTTEPANDELDYAVLRLATKAAGSPLDVVAQGARGYFPLGQSVSVNVGKPVFIFQHPQPGAGQPQLPLQLAIGKVLAGEWSELRLRYDTNTLGGSSGSPCLDEALKLAALHHAGDPAWYAPPQFNQAVPIAKIRADLATRAAEFTAQNVSPFWN